MAEPSYFQNALQHFMFESASGGAVRHLTDLGYTVKQVAEKLDFPTPFELVRQKVWERLLDTGVILTQEPGCVAREKVCYVREYDPYGRASFRRVEEPCRETLTPCWHDLAVGQKETEEVRALLQEKTAENGVRNAYVSCDFGLVLKRDPGKYQEILSALKERDREYVEGLPWEEGKVYHRLDSHMQEMIPQLYEKGLWQGTCYFLKTGERVQIRKNSGKEIRNVSDHCNVEKRRGPHPESGRHVDI